MNPWAYLCLVALLLALLCSGIALWEIHVQVSAFLDRMRQGKE